MPSGARSFVEIDADNVVCTAIKPAEQNGQGLVIRFHELTGQTTQVNVRLAVPGKIAAATATSLIEVDLESLKVLSDDRFVFDIDGHGLKTVRVAAAPQVESIRIVQAQAVADMEVELTLPTVTGDGFSHYAIYRGVSPDFPATISNLVGRTRRTEYTDAPQLNRGGWPHNVLQPNTQYYYRVCAIDRWNNSSRSSPAVACKTLESSNANTRPLPVEGLCAVHVTANGAENFVQLWFYTSCELDVETYEVYRGTAPDFEPSTANLVETIDARELQPCRDNQKYPKKELNRQMISDKSVCPNQVYFYKACAVDRLGLKSELCEPFSIEMKVPELVFAVDRELHADAFTTRASVTMNWPNSADQICYTLDKSKPTHESARFGQPIHLDWTTLVRAAVYSQESGELLCRARRFVQVAQAFSQSDYGHTYAARMALDGASGVDSCWVSLPYGGELKENPADIWLSRAIAVDAEFGRTADRRRRKGSRRYHGSVRRLLARRWRMEATRPGSQSRRYSEEPIRRGVDRSRARHGRCDKARVSEGSSASIR